MYIRAAILALMYFVSSAAVLAQGRDVSTPAADLAIEEYNQEIRQIEGEAARKKAAALGVLMQKLEDAQKAATKAEDLDAALAIREKRRQFSAGGATTQPATEKPALSVGSPNDFFQGMLGRYRAGDQPLPIILLSVPNGSNVLSEPAKRAINRANIDIGTLVFEGKALLPIPHDGAYALTASRSVTLEIDGKLIDLANYNKRHTVSVRLNKGLHEVAIRSINTNNQLGETSVDVINILSGKQVPLCIRASDADEMLQVANPDGPEEVSSWIKRRQRIEFPKALLPGSKE